LGQKGVKGALTIGEGLSLGEPHSGGVKMKASWKFGIFGGYLIPGIRVKSLGNFGDNWGG